MQQSGSGIQASAAVKAELTSDRGRVVGGQRRAPLQGNSRVTGQPPARRPMQQQQSTSIPHPERHASQHKSAQSAVKSPSAKGPSTSSSNRDGGALPPVERLLVVVEGINDMLAVRRAVPSDVFVLGSSTMTSSLQLAQSLTRASSGYAAVVVLTDPDVAGRQARQALDDQLPGCYHAFVPEPLATAQTATEHHDEGNVGIEHAAPAAIRRALSLMRRSNAHRTEFTREQLLTLGLAAPMNQKGGHVTERRNLVCSFLGIGQCDGKQLLRQLNRYCFTADDLEAALAWAETSLNSTQGA